MMSAVQKLKASRLIWGAFCALLVSGCRFNTAPTLPYSSLLAEIDAGNVAGVVISSSQATVTLRSTGSSAAETFVVELPHGADKLIQKLEANSVDFRVSSS